MSEKPIFPRGWSLRSPKDPENQSPGNPINREDNGFSHLNIQTPVPVHHSPQRLLPKLEFSNKTAETQYLALLHKKLKCAVSFLKLENTHNLSSLRPFYAEPAVMALTQGPSPISLYMIDLMRDLMDGKVELEEMGVNDPRAVKEETERKVEEYVSKWKMMVGSLVILVPGGSEEVAHRLLDETVGYALVDRL
jgi:hypothetical protein